jgi:hypothetical protein
MHPRTTPPIRLGRKKDARNNVTPLNFSLSRYAIKKAGTLMHMIEAMANMVVIRKECQNPVSLKTVT